MRAEGRAQSWGEGDASLGCISIGSRLGEAMGREHELRVGGYATSIVGVKGGGRAWLVLGR